MIGLKFTMSFSQSNSETGMSVEEKLAPHKHDKKATECGPYDHGTNARYTQIWGPWENLINMA